MPENVAVAGLVLVLAGGAFAAERALSLPRWAAFALVGASALAVGVTAVAIAARRLAAQELALPRTLEEFSKDIDALTSRGTGP
jgi:hypothetical protein